MRNNIHNLVVPENAKEYITTIPTKFLTDLLITPPPFFGSNPVKGRDSLLATSFNQAIENLQKRLGPDHQKWQYGQEKNKHIKVTHPLAQWVEDPALLARINHGPLPRGGYGETVNNTSNNLNQSHGASFKIIVDTENWDRTLGINHPGQSGDPRSKHYGDLFQLWGTGGYFPVYFSKSKIIDVAESKMVLRP